MRLTRPPPLPPFWPLSFPDTVSIASLNRQCSSGLQAVANVAAAIKAGFIDIGIGAGVESMTKARAPAPIHKRSQTWAAGLIRAAPAASKQNYGARSQPEEISQDVLSNESAADCLLPMGITSENVAERYHGTVLSVRLYRAVFCH